MNQHVCHTAPGEGFLGAIRGLVASTVLLLTVLTVVLVLTFGHTVHGIGSGTSGGTHVGIRTHAASTHTTPDCRPTRVVHWC